MANVLIATLGESPIVVTGMCAQLKQKEHIDIDHVIVLHSSGEQSTDSYMMIEDALKDQCQVDDPLSLEAEDVHSEQESFKFLQRLFALLSSQESLGNNVYLSLAGGRKNMSAVMGLVAPFYECIKGLYHLIDKDEHTSRKNFLSVDDLFRLSDDVRNKKLMSDLDSLLLVPIPFDDALRIGKAYRQKLENQTPEQLQALWNVDASEAEEQQIFGTLIEQQTQETILDVLLTEDAERDYRQFCERKPDLARDFATCFRYMRFATHLADARRTHGTVGGILNGKSHPFHYYKKGHTNERPFFHTEPGDIANYPHTKTKVTQVIISGLAVHRSAGPDYDPPTRQLLARTWQQLTPMDKILDQSDRVLIVPMGTTPMIATQLYTLLTRQGHKIHEVVLIYPENADRVRHSVEMVIEAFEHHGHHVPCTPKPIAEIEDVDTKENCIVYRQALEQTINDVRKEILRQHTTWQIDLSLSGGRKGMAVLAIFAAQSTGLREVYHTLITNRQFDQRMEDETTLKALRSLSHRERNRRLFLDAYADHIQHFQVFKVPIGPRIRR
jgi:CRISPR-associated Csx14 family protein